MSFVITEDPDEREDRAADRDRAEYEAAQEQQASKETACE